MNYRYLNVIKQFDKQIKEEAKQKNSAGKVLCIISEKQRPSYWKKLLFINSIDLDISDWKKIRDNEYWENMNSLTGIEKDKYKLEKILNYNKSNK
jgi:hypothetical protein